MEKSVSKTHNMEDEEVILLDRISDLPDSLLHHILSFLSTKEASSISLLSKRWNSIWLSQPSLDFNDKSFSILNSFVHFVDSVLNILKDSSDSITMFRIKYSGCSHLRPNNKFEDWVKAVLNLGVQHLELWFPYWFVVNLPSSMFVCNTIRVLKLNGSRVGDISSANLPSLKVLHLENVHFPCFKCVSMILSKCVLLEKLVLKGISTSDYDHNIEMLQHLTTVDDVVVPSLLTATTYEIPTFYNLTHLEISMAHPLSIILKWLQNCPKLQILVIDTVKDERSTLLHDVSECLILSISHMMEVYVNDFLGSESEFQFAEVIMKNADCLKTFSIGTSKSTPVDWKNQMRKRLCYLPKASVNCRLLFQDT